MNKESDEQTVCRTYEQRMRDYRERIREKLVQRGVPGDELERRTDEIFHRSLDLDLESLFSDPEPVGPNRRLTRAGGYC